MAFFPTILIHWSTPEVLIPRDIFGNVSDDSRRAGMEWPPFFGVAAEFKLKRAGMSRRDSEVHGQVTKPGVGFQLLVPWNHGRIDDDAACAEFIFPLAP
jgi:hypothetical protein